MIPNEPDASLPAPSPAASTRGGKILLIEDKEGLRNVLKRTLEDEGFSVEACAEGGSALARLAEESYQLLLTDLKLPYSSPSFFSSAPPPPPPL